MKCAPDEDRQAILRVVDEETAAYFDKDYERWARCWVQAPYGRRWMWLERGGITVREGWDDHGPRMKRGMERYPAPNASTREIRRVNINLRAARDMAWVTFDQHSSRTGDVVFDVSGLQKEMRILEKHNSEWKIACICVMQRSLDHATSPLMRVDENAVVSWANAAADERFRQRDVLMIRAGKLRAASREADQRLQAAIRWAASRDDDPAGHVIAVHEGSLPVLLTSRPGEPATMCWVIARNGMILVELNDQQLTESQLAPAAAILGLSPAQLRLAALIVSGSDLVEAARHLGISVNTVRTQLQRMFEKSGVRSQPALVRVLLSYASRLA